MANFICVRSVLVAVPVAALLVVALVTGAGPVLPGGGIAQAADTFVEGFDELPLMPGLAVVHDQSLTFDQPAGRIVQAVARGSVTAEAVLRFYRETVPQLGWHRGRGEDRYVRDGELLRVEILPARADRSVVTVRFSLSPE